MDIVIVLISIILFNQFFYKTLKKKYPFINIKMLNILFVYHLLFFVIYYTYALFRPSDSKHYYYVSKTADDWLHFFNTGTDFISFLAIPFVKAGLSYPATMLLFSWFGFLGFIYTYLFLEKILESLCISSG